MVYLLLNAFLGYSISQSSKEGDNNLETRVGKYHDIFEKPIKHCTVGSIVTAIPIHCTSARHIVSAIFKADPVVHVAPDDAAVV